MRSTRSERSGGMGRKLPIGASILPSGTLLHGRTRALYQSAPLARENAPNFRHLFCSSSSGKTHLKVKCSTRNECAAAATAAAPIFRRDVRGSVFHAHRGVRGAFDRLGANKASIAAPLARSFLDIRLLAAIPRRAVKWVRMATIAQKHRATLLRARAGRAARHGRNELHARRGGGERVGRKRRSTRAALSASLERPRGARARHREHRVYS